MSKVIFHIDLNSYFVSVERALNSDLNNVPIAVSGNLFEYSIITSASYEARQVGVKSGMTNKEALKIFPDLVIVPSHFEVYRAYTKKFFEIIKKFSPYIEPASIDECYVDVSEVIKQFKRPLDLAWIIQNKLLQELKLPCSIGIASNKFLAKMASDLKKPLGITILRKNQIKEKLWHLPISEFHGIGKNTEKKLKTIGIQTIGDFASETNYLKIKQLLGVQSEQLLLKIKGFDTSPLNYNQSPQSISQSKTYTKELTNYENIVNELRKMAKKVIERALQKKMFGKLVSITIRYQNYKTIIRSTSLANYFNDEETLIETALLLLEQNYNLMPIKLLGISLGSLVEENMKQKQLTIFEIPKVDIKEELNKQLESGKLTYLSELKK